MPDIISDGMTKVSWVETLAAPGAPTAVELNAGVSLEDLITPDGYGMTTTQDMVDAGSLASTQDTELMGRHKDSGALTFKHQGDAEVPWTTFEDVTPGVRPTGFLVTRFGIPAGVTFTTGQKVDVMPAQAGYRGRLPSAKNEVMKFTVPIAATGATLQSVAVV